MIEFLIPLPRVFGQNGSGGLLRLFTLSNSRWLEVVTYFFKPSFTLLFWFLQIEMKPYIVSRNFSLVEKFFYLILTERRMEKELVNLKKWKVFTKVHYLFLVPILKTRVGDHTTRRLLSPKTVPLLRLPPYLSFLPRFYPFFYFFLLYRKYIL